MIKVVSTQQQYAQAIYNGTKTLELRRHALNINPGEFMMLYESLPSGAIRGGFFVTEVIKLSLYKMLENHLDELDMDEEEVKDLYKRKLYAFAFRVGQIVTLDKPITLKQLNDAGYNHPFKVAYWTLPVPKELQPYFNKTVYTHKVS